MLKVVFTHVNTAFIYKRELLVCSFLQYFSMGKGSSLQCTYCVFTLWARNIKESMIYEIKVGFLVCLILKTDFCPKICGHHYPRIILTRESQSQYRHPQSGIIYYHSIDSGLFYPYIPKSSQAAKASRNYDVIKYFGSGKKR